VNLIPEMGIVKELPIVLNSTSYEVDYEGDRDHDTRSVIWTLNFTVKGFIFGQTTSAGLIKNSITNILSDITENDIVQFTMSNTGIGIYKTDELVYQGHSPVMPTATGRVVYFSPDHYVLHLTEINGHFVSDKPVIGVNTNSNYSFTSYQIQPQNIVTIDVKPNPLTANANSNYTYTTTITEYS
jgi:hypothetical protein